MKITEIRINLVDGGSRLRAMANVTIDNSLAIHGVKIIEGEKGLFVAMPSTKIGDEFKDIVHPINHEARETMQKEILAAYEEAVKTVEK